MTFNPSRPNRAGTKEASESEIIMKKNASSFRNHSVPGHNHSLEKCFHKHCPQPRNPIVLDKILSRSTSKEFGSMCSSTVAGVHNVEELIDFVSERFGALSGAPGAVWCTRGYLVHRRLSGASEHYLVHRGLSGAPEAIWCTGGCLVHRVHWHNN